VQFFVNPTRGSKDIERTRKRDGQTDGRTDTQTDNGAKNDMSPHFMWGYIIKLGLVLINFIQYYTIPNRAGYILSNTVTVWLIFIIIMGLTKLRIVTNSHEQSRIVSYCGSKYSPVFST